MKLRVIVKSGINNDGFDTIIEDNGRTVDEQSWNYDRNCTCDKQFARFEDKPYVTDVLQGLIDKYNVGELSIEAGKNIFAHKDIAPDMVEAFKNNYCQTLFLRGIDLSKPDADENEFIPREVWMAEDVQPDFIRQHVQNGGKLYMVDEPHNGMAQISSEPDSKQSVSYPLDYFRQEVRIKEGCDPLMPYDMEQHVKNGGKLYAIGATKDFSGIENFIIYITTEPEISTKLNGDDMPVCGILASDVEYVNIKTQDNTQDFADAVAAIPVSGNSLEQ